MGERGTAGGRGLGRPFDFERAQPHSNDVLYLGDCDAAVRELAAALGWQADLHGVSTVCGSSSLVGEFGRTDMCVRERSYSEAVSLCTEMGGRLCTAAELEQEEGDPQA